MAIGTISLSPYPCAANAATVQITFTGSYFSSSTGDHLDTDIGNDGVSDLRGVVTSGPNGAVFVYGPHNSMVAKALKLGTRGYARLGSFNPFVMGSGVQVSAGLYFLSLTDSNVRGGVTTLGYLDMTATGGAVGEKGRVDIHRFIFDAATGGTIAGLHVTDSAFTEYTTSAVPAIPEPSRLGLLALGAGGLLARRRRVG